MSTLRRHFRHPLPTPQVRRLSRLYESAPAYVTDQPPFLNAAAVVETALPPLDLLRRLKDIEVRSREACTGGGEECGEALLLS